MNTLLGISIGVSVAMLLYWGVGLWRVLRLSRSMPTAADGLELEPSDERVCLVIPAHNEASNIEPLLRSIIAQTHRSWRVVLAFDRCTDDTARIAADVIGADDRFEIFEIEDCPPEWAGKVNALWQGVTQSSGANECDVLLFVDADTALHPECLRATLALRRDRRLDLLSLLPNVTSRHWWEWVTQPAAGFELMRQYPLSRTNREGYPRPFVNGQFIMIDRSAYDRIGGHQAVHDEMLEDLAIGRLAAAAGLRSGAFFAGGMVTCRMYDSWAQFKSGWSRIFAEASRRRVERLSRAALQVRIFGAVLPAFTLAGIVASFLGLGLSPAALCYVTAALTGLALICFLGTLCGSFRPAGLPWRSIIAYPIGAWIVSGVIRGAAGKVERREMTSWAGREYQFAPR